MKAYGLIESSSENPVEQFAPKDRTLCGRNPKTTTNYRKCSYFVTPKSSIGHMKCNLENHIKFILQSD